MTTESRWKHHGVRVVHANELDIPAVEKPEEVHWVDNIHPDPNASLIITVVITRSPS